MYGLVRNEVFTRRKADRKGNEARHVLLSYIELAEQDMPRERCRVAEGPWDLWPPENQMLRVAALVETDHLLGRTASTLTQ